MALFGGGSARFDAVRVSSTPGAIYNIPSTIQLSPRYDLKRKKNVPLFTTIRVPKPERVQQSEETKQPAPVPEPPSAAEIIARSAAAFVDPEQVIRDALAKSEADRTAAATDALKPHPPRSARRNASPATPSRPTTAVRTAEDIKAWLHEQKQNPLSQRHGGSGSPPPPGAVRLKEVDRGDWLLTNPNRVMDTVSPALYEPQYYADSRHARPPTASLQHTGRNVVWRKLNDDSPGPKYDVSNLEIATSKYKSSPSPRRPFMPDTNDRLSLLTRGTFRHGLILFGADANSGVGPGAYDVSQAVARQFKGPSAVVSGRHGPTFISSKHSLQDRAGIHSPGAIYDYKHPNDIGATAAPKEQIIRPKYKLPDSDEIRAHDREVATHLSALQTTLRTHHEHETERAMAAAHAHRALSPRQPASARPATASAAYKPYEYDPRTIPGLLSNGDSDDESKFTAEEKAERAAKAEAEEAAKKAEADRAAALKLAQQTPRGVSRAKSAGAHRKRVNQWKTESHGLPASRDSWLHGVVSKRPSTAGGSVMVERQFQRKVYAPGPGAYSIVQNSAFQTTSFNASARKSRARRERRSLQRGRASLFAPSLTARELVEQNAIAHPLNPDSYASFPSYSKYATIKMNEQIRREAERQRAAAFAVAQQNHLRQTPNKSKRSSLVPDSPAAATASAAAAAANDVLNDSGVIRPHKPRAPAERSYSKSPTHPTALDTASAIGSPRPPTTPSAANPSLAAGPASPLFYGGSPSPRRPQSKLQYDGTARPVHFKPRVYG